MRKAFCSSRFLAALIIAITPSLLSCAPNCSSAPEEYIENSTALDGKEKMEKLELLKQARRLLIELQNELAIKEKMAQTTDWIRERVGSGVQNKLELETAELDLLKQERQVTRKMNDLSEKMQQIPLPPALRKCF